MGMGVRLFSSVEAQDRAPGYPADLSKVGLGEEDELRGRATAAHTLGLIEARQARKAGSEPDRPGGAPILERLLELLDHPVGPDDPRDDKNQKQDQPTDPDHQRRAHGRKAYTNPAPVRSGGQIRGLHQPLGGQAEDEVARQAAGVSLPGKGFGTGRQAEGRVAHLVQKEPDGGAEESPFAETAAVAAAQKSIGGAGAHADRPVDRLSGCLALSLGELAAGEAGDFLRRRLIRRPAAAGLVLTFARGLVL